MQNIILNKKVKNLKLFIYNLKHVVMREKNL